MLFVVAIQATRLDLDQLNHSRLKARDVPCHLFMFSRPREPFFPLTVKRNFVVRLVLDNELAASVMRLRTGLSADVEHLAIEIIGNVMNGTRNYLGQKHTLKHIRAGELALTKLAERNSWETWDEKLERKQMVDHAIEAAEKILREHQVAPLEPQPEFASPPRSSSRR